MVSVAPLVGAWIEIFLDSDTRCSGMSLPSWERGLKSMIVILILSEGAVAPLVGAWIEIICSSTARILIPSLPSWERGLK